LLGSALSANDRFQGIDGLGLAQGQYYQALDLLQCSQNDKSCRRDRVHIFQTPTHVTMIDAGGPPYLTPHIEQLHVIERHKLTDGGKAIDISIYVDEAPADHGCRMWDRAKSRPGCPPPGLGSHIRRTSPGR
jgi:hypothetical protein